MGLDITQIKDRRPEPPRDQWDRYVATDAEGNPKVFRRSTSVAKKIGNTFGLEGWQQGQVACGMGQRPTLVKLAQANPDWYVAKQLYREIVEAAFEASGANEGRRLGTALHGLTQDLDEGRMTDDRLADVAEIDPLDVKRLELYHEALAKAGIRVDTSHIEQVLLLDSPAIAGTADRFCWLPDGRYCVLDLKTGKLDYGEVEWAAQLSMYANHDATWNHIQGDQWERGPKLPGVDLETAIIVHLPAQGEPECTIWELDLELGYSALIYASYVLDFGNMKAMRPYGASAQLAPQPGASAQLAPISNPISPAATPEAIREWIAGRIAEAGRSQIVVDSLDAGPMTAVQFLMARWPKATVPMPLPEVLSPVQEIDLDRVLTLVETKYQLPFSGARPGTTVADVKAPATVTELQVPTREPKPPAPKKTPAKKAAAAKRGTTPARKKATVTPINRNTKKES
jgi:hypothetical protein